MSVALGISVGPHGRVTLGLPGSGLFWTEQIPPGPHVQRAYRVAFTIVIVAGLAMLVWAIVAASH